MNSLLYYYNNVQKMAAYRQAKRMQRGIKLEYQTNKSKFSLSPIYIGANDFSLQYYGNFYYSGLAGYLSCIFDNNDYNNGFRCYGRSYVEWVLFDSVISDGIQIPYPRGIDFTQRFNLVITRKGASVKAYINGELKATKEQSEVKDLGDIQFAITRASDVGFVRVWNYALSADDIATLYNNGDPMGYVVPKAKRDGLLAEYLPQNLMSGRDDKTIATSWLDSAKQLPLSDEYMEPLFQSIGGYDMAANGAPEILYNE